MRLKSIYIDDNKNLKDLTLTFDGKSFIDVFVGKNDRHLAKKLSKLAMQGLFSVFGNPNNMVFAYPPTVV